MGEPGDSRSLSAHLERLNRVYRAISLCGGNLVRASNEHDLLEALCRTLVDTGGYPLAWVGFPEGPRARMKPAAVAGAPEARAYLEEVLVTASDEELGRGPTGTAFRTGQPAINRDTETNPHFGPWKGQALKRGFRSSIAVPLVAQGRSLGTLNVYAAVPDAFDSDERDLLVRFGEDLAFALDSLHTRLALEDTQERLRRADDIRTRFAILDDAPGGFMALDRTWRYLYLNGPGARQVGHTPASLTGKVIWEVFPQAVGGPFWTAYHHTMETREAVDFESYYAQLDKWFEVRVYPIEPGIAVYFSDITERKKLEAQFRQAQKMEAIGVLAGGVAHDFNNLLSVILSYASLVHRGLDPGSPLAAEVAEIQRAGERAAELTRQLLAFSRQQVLQPKVLDLGEVVTGLKSMLQRMLGEDIELALRIDAPHARVWADPSQVEQIVMNLCVNARDAMPKGGRLSIEISELELKPGAVHTADLAPGHYVRLAVSDTGTGMTPEVRERIFEPFFSTKEQGKGTGLGLSTVFGIVKQSRGHIGVRSEPGQGTTFEVLLPRSEASPKASAAAPAPPASLRGRETILLVEDDEQVRAVTCTVLRDAGYTVLDAQNAGEAFLISEQHKGEIQLLLTDVVMPRLSGPELAAKLGPTRPAMRVLLMSGYVDNHRGALPESAAALPLLMKPVTPEALLRKLREVLGPPR